MVSEDQFELVRELELYVGAGFSTTEALESATIVPAHLVGADKRTGSIEVGKNADVVLWSGDPFSVYTRSEKIWIDGAMMFDRSDPSERWRTDFELGYVPAAEQTGGSK